MAWDHLDITKPHLVYIILGGFTSLFMLCSSFIKERMYIGEATVATLCGVIFGPHAADLINPQEWGSVDIVTVEFSRIVLVVQCFAVGVELPKFYMEKHWKSVIYLLVPVMTVGWLLVSLFVWWMFDSLNWLDSLVIAACVTATDPVLASSVVGKGKFAKRVPKHLRDLLSAESGCNDGMAFPFIYLSLYLLQFHRNTKEVSFHFVVYVVLYECIFGAVYGFLIGYIARHGIKMAEKYDLIDRESFLVFYFVVALFCAGSGSILGVDDLLVGFAAGVGFSNDGWFGEKTEESHVSNVIDLLLNLAYFVYLGTIIPWEQYNDGYLGMHVWKLVVIAVFVIFFRRIPVMMMLKPLIPDIKTWREALFAGHFGPIGVGAIFVAMLARAELEHEEPIPLGTVPPANHEFHNVIYLVWPIVTFLVITSIVVHGSSIAVFTLGKRINTLTLTMSYTAAPEDGPSWMNRLPRISSQSRSQAKMSETSLDDYDEVKYPGNALTLPTGFLRRQRDESSRPNSRASSLVSRRRKHKRWDDGIGPGGPVSQSAIFPNRQPDGSTPLSPTETDKDEITTSQETTGSTLREDEKELERETPRDTDSDDQSPRSRNRTRQVDVYEEGDDLVFENREGDVLAVESESPPNDEEKRPSLATTGPSRGRAGSKSEMDRFRNWTFDGIMKKVSDVYSSEVEKRKGKTQETRKHEPARAYQFGNTIIVEDADGEVVKTFELPNQRTEGGANTSDKLASGFKYMGLGGSRKAQKSPEAVAEEGEAGESSGAVLEKTESRFHWNMLAGQQGARRKSSVAQHQATPSDDKIRFTIGGVGQRMTKEDFIREVQKLDGGSRREAVESSDAPSDIKQFAQQRPVRRATETAAVPRIREQAPSQSPPRSTSPERGRSRGDTLPSGSPMLSPPSRPKSNLRPTYEEPGETAAERRRRLLTNPEGVNTATTPKTADPRRRFVKEDSEARETPAERRRREAALGMGDEVAQESSDSEDEGERVPPTKRGIRFAEPTRDRR